MKELHIEITSTEIKTDQRNNQTFRSQEAHAFIEGDKYPKTINLPIRDDRQGMPYPVGEYDLSFGVQINRFSRPMPVEVLVPRQAKSASGPKAVNS